MKAEDLAFYNQQLAGMLKSGLPLEGALSELSKELRSGPLKEETTRLEKDLAQGTPLNDAIEKGSFPPFYKKLLGVGAQSGHMHDVLILLADYYHRSSLIWNRLKGMLVYPLLVLVTAFSLSLFLAITFSNLYDTMLGELIVFQSFRTPQNPNPIFLTALTVLSPIVFGILLMGALAALVIPRVRNMARWRFPGLREASLAQMAGTCAVLLKGGLPLQETIDMVTQLEAHPSIKQDLEDWQRRHAEGASKFAEIAKQSRSFPPLFIWLVASSGEAMADGFEKAATLYQRRADYRSELFIVAAAPISLLITLALVILQVYPMIRAMTMSLGFLGQF